DQSTAMPPALVPSGRLRPPLRLGHRGHRVAGWQQSENTMAAFDRALAAGCDGLELDLRHSADGRVVVLHDAELRTGAGAVAVGEATLPSLRRLHPELATLEQVLRRYRQRAWLDLELKTAAAAPLVVPLLRRWPPQRGFVLSSFELDCLKQLRELGPDLPLCWNLRRARGLRQLHAAQVGWIAPQQAWCTAWYVRRLKAEGWKVLVWTVNRPARMRLLARAGADAIASDNPELLVRTLPDAAVQQTD
ncbi:MAG: glycerophosphodiester phosphodiesterase, partial [Terriglobales bacterium]